MVKTRWMESRGNSRGRQITCKHVSTFDRSVGELGALATMSGGACHSAVVPQSVLIFSLFMRLIKRVSGNLVLYRAPKCGSHFTKNNSGLFSISSPIPSQASSG